MDTNKIFGDEYGLHGAIGSTYTKPCHSLVMLVGLVWIIPLFRPRIHACVSNNLHRFTSYHASRLFWFKVASISTPFTLMLFDQLKPTMSSSTQTQQASAKRLTLAGRLKIPIIFVICRSYPVQLIVLRACVDLHSEPSNFIGCLQYYYNLFLQARKKTAYQATTLLLHSV